MALAFLACGAGVGFVVRAVGASGFVVIVDGQASSVVSVPMLSDLLQTFDLFQATRPRFVRLPLVR